MSVLGKLLLPITLAPRGLLWVFEKVQEEADRELNDPVRLRGELMALQRRAAAGELNDAQYMAQEDRILARLDAIELRQEADRVAATEPARPPARPRGRSVGRHVRHVRRGRT